MKSKVVLITGTSSGFGKACAEHLHSLGHRVYGTSRKATVVLSENLGGGYTTIPLDVSDDDSVRAGISFVQEREGRIDVVVNNAGIGLAGSIEDTSIDEAKMLFETNFFGVHRVCRAVLPLLRAQGSGLIVNVSSIGGLITIPFQGFYSASKYALESMTDALRMELAPCGVAVCLIEPGDFKTGFTAARVFATASRSGSAYADRCRRAVEAMERDEQNGANPQALAVLLAKIIAARRPQPRYLAGMPVQKLGPLVKSVLPARWFDKILMSMYRI
ncbi:MAG: SDR family oxidoreductase [Deltaproteobacteria bacterium]|nr:SDR family oxidoreductase [Deltaproteobacteria bacterium]